MTDPMRREIRKLVRMALREDIGPGDLTVRACVPEQVRATARLIAREELVLAGIEAARIAFLELDPDCRFLQSASDGERIGAGREILVVEGLAAPLLMAERVALNFLQHLSGVATVTAAYVAAVAHTRVRVVDTRKTTPGLRSLEKYAVRCGGGKNHRVGLFDGVLIKENHIRAAGGIAAAVTACRREAHHLTRIEVEVTSLAELGEAVDAGADVVMLDNFPLDQIPLAVAQAAGRVLLEVSGGVDLDRIRAIAETGVDLISVGRLTHSAPSVDISMLFDLPVTP